MLGDIVVCLYDETPIHRDNFLKLAKDKLPSLYPYPIQVVLKYYPSRCKPFGLGYTLATPWVHLGYTLGRPWVDLG